MDHLGNIYSASTVSLDGRQTNNGIAEPDGIIHRLVSVTLVKEEPGTDPSFLVNTLRELLNKNQEEGDLKWNRENKEVILVHFSSQVGEQILGKCSSIKGKLQVHLGIFKNSFTE